jgi:hypothetical protein
MIRMRHHSEHSITQMVVRWWIQQPYAWSRDILWSGMRSLKSSIGSSRKVGRAARGISSKALRFTSTDSPAWHIMNLIKQLTVGNITYSHEYQCLNALRSTSRFRFAFADLCRANCSSASRENACGPPPVWAMSVQNWIPFGNGNSCTWRFSLARRSKWRFSHEIAQTDSPNHCVKVRAKMRGTVCLWRLFLETEILQAGCSWICGNH